MKFLEEMLTKKQTMKKIKIGAVHIASFNPKNGKMFSWDYYYDPNDEFYDDSCKKDVKECDPKEIILKPNTPYELLIDYPTSTPYRKRFNTGKKGMTRIQLADYICKNYRKMYAEEDKTAGGDPGHIPGMFNRAQSEGKYGIWGHDIGDLVLCSVTIDSKNFITLGVSS